MMLQSQLETEFKFPTNNLGTFRKLLVSATVGGKGGLSLPLMLAASSVGNVEFCAQKLMKSSISQVQQRRKDTQSDRTSNAPVIGLYTWERA